MKNFWNKASEKTRLLLSGLLALCFTLLAYTLAIKPTVELRQHLRTLEHQRDTLAASLETHAKAGQNKMLSITTEPNLSHAQTKLLQQLEQLTKRRSLDIRQIPEPELFDREGKKIALMNVVVEGRFYDHVALVDHIEKTLPGIYLQSVQVQSVLNQRTKETHLFNSLHFKTVIL